MGQVRDRSSSPDTSNWTRRVPHVVESTAAGVITEERSWAAYCRPTKTFSHLSRHGQLADRSINHPALDPREIARPFTGRFVGRYRCGIQFCRGYM